MDSDGLFTLLVTYLYIFLFLLNINNDLTLLLPYYRFYVGDLYNNFIKYLKNGKNYKIIYLIRGLFMVIIY